MFLITGCGRSGTVYMSKVLNRAGLRVGHERAGEDGAVSPIWVVGGKHYPRYHQQGQRPEFDLVLHQVRHPLQAIASLTTTMPSSWKWLAKHVPICLEDHVVQLAAEFWLYWNLLAQGASEYMYRIEDLEQAWPRIRQLTGAKGPYGDAVEGIPKDTNKRSHRVLTWHEIESATPLAGAIRRLAKQYGYREAE